MLCDFQKDLKNTNLVITPGDYSYVIFEFIPFSILSVVDQAKFEVDIASPGIVIFDISDIETGY